MADLDMWPRIEAAIYDTKVGRADAEWQWPRCHKRGCQCQNDIDFVFSLFTKAIADSVYKELLCKAVTEPDDGGVR
ncbi:hypothetical protein nbrc107696_45860 [Gordonia spumicola]|uniref:Uncharacterized protein n=1 Tax=Gordonia spumicola TaxID=589161 RepID=A0A7I9V5B5_9ACTN|nr:hypothetical protein [Gordonia spumicola]GEE00211.1 hypothetical protein nbrc107696_06570 [Gordonia spumicola]GEE04140.1 hypothetical protein nbrc107696_45860 [Gordonia spumicola]